MQQIETLNRRLADQLGRVGGKPRFAWCWAPDLFYYHRNQPDQSWTRHSWAERLGKSWVLAQAKPPMGIGPAPWDSRETVLVPITREQWWTSFHGEFPFPGGIELYPLTETALKPGLVPDDLDTAFYISSLVAQMTKTMREIKEEIDKGLEKDRLYNKQEFFDMAADWFPAFWSTAGGAHEPGTRGGHVSFT